MRDDTLHETPAVAEAIRRLPKDIQGERSFRISRAFLLSTQKAILPKEEWTKYEEVHKAVYLLFTIIISLHLVI